PGRPAVASANKLISQPVRSGQQMYAPDGDLILLGTVNAGAEVLADGNIHIYGHLRGRALAGARGNREARIFCQSLEAELVSIAGRYRVFEEMDAEVRGTPTQIFLADDRLIIEPLTR
nr:septum site-determining protein MinC [Pseudomonadota bacterium]